MHPQTIWRAIIRTDREERGQSLSVFVLLVMTAIIMIAGLVIDGGQVVNATSRAESAAAGAARAAGNAAATGTVVGQPNVEAAIAAAQNYLAGSPGVTGSVAVSAGVVTVQTKAIEGTIFLSVLGINSVTGRGDAQVQIVATGAGG